MTQQDKEQGRPDNLPLDQQKSEDQDRLDKYPIPPMPGQDMRKPLLEKVDQHFGEVFFDRMRSHGSRFNGKKGWILLFCVILIVGLGLAYFLWPRPQAAPSPVSWDLLPVAQLQKTSYQLLSGEAGLLDRLNQAFRLETESGADLSDQYADQSLLLHAERDNPASALTLQAQPQAKLSLEDALLHLQVLLAQRDSKAFRQAQVSISETYADQLGPEAPSSSWPAKLAYLRQLFLASQYWPEDEVFAEIDRLSGELLPLFAADLDLAHHEVFEEVIPTVLSSNEKESYQAERDLEVVRLDQIDLWVLQALASRDPAWQDMADKWLEIARKARLDSGFYAYAWDPATQSYVPSAGSTFQADTLASLTQIRYLWEVGEGKPEDLLTFNQLLMTAGQFYESYNQINLTPIGDETSLPALLAYKEVSLLAGQSLSLDLANQSLKLLTRGDSIPAGQGFLYRPGQEDTFYFQDNYQNLLLKAWELSLSESE